MTNTTFKKSNPKSNGTVKASSPKEDYSKMLKKDLIIELDKQIELSAEKTKRINQMRDRYNIVVDDRKNDLRVIQGLKSNLNGTSVLKEGYRKDRTRNAYWAIFFALAFIFTSIGWILAAT